LQVLSKEQESADWVPKNTTSDDTSIAIFHLVVILFTYHKCYIIMITFWLDNVLNSYKLCFLKKEEKNNPNKLVHR